MTDGWSDGRAREHEPFEEPLEVDPTEAVEEGEPYFPPTDPVVGERNGEIEVNNGFGATAMDDDAPPGRPVSGGTPDAELEELVRRELEQDAATTDLDVEVSVRDGVVTLRGRVSDIEDDENAVAVAGRVPGVVDVVDEIEIQARA